MKEDPPPPYDLAVAYRIYPGVSGPARALQLADDKLRLAETCLRSFRESLGPLRARVWAILDGCPPSYREMFLRHFDERDVVPVELEGAGNRATFDLQLDILLAQQDAPLVYFAEDDYLYLPDRFPALLDFMAAHDDVDFVSPYDHLDCYTLALHRYPSWIRAHGGLHWRTAGSTCLTFLSRRSTLERTESVFRSYGRGNSDCALWLTLTKEVVTRPAGAVRAARADREFASILRKAWRHGWRDIVLGERFTLWTPIPSLATHLAADRLAPGFDWHERLQEASERSAATESGR